MNSNDMALRESGQGTPIVLVHGFPGNAHDWDRVAHMLSASHRVIQPDLLGFGQSAKPTRFEDVWVDAQAAAIQSVEHAKRVAASVPEGRLKLYPGAGHFPHIEVAAQYEADITSFIASH